MMRQDGDVVLYLVQHKRRDDSGRWDFSNFDRFWCPNRFLGEAYRKWGVRGSLDRDEAKECLDEVRKKNPGYTFRMVRRFISQRTSTMD